MLAQQANKWKWFGLPLKRLPWHYPPRIRSVFPGSPPVFVHPGTADIDCAGDRLKHISTQLAPAAEKHINWLHWEPCLVTMAKHTGRVGVEGWGLIRGSGFSRVSGAVSQRSFPLLYPCLSFSASLSLCLALSLSCPVSPSFSLFRSLSLFHLVSHSSVPLCLALTQSLTLSLSHTHHLHISFSLLPSSLYSYLIPPLRHNLFLFNLPLFLPFPFCLFFCSQCGPLLRGTV